jgi:hypothetical protein
VRFANDVPWFPDFVGAVELARRQTRDSGRADPVAQYLRALSMGDARRLETMWPGNVVVFDPRAGEVRGHRQLRRFVHGNMSWLAEHEARIEQGAAIAVEGRAVVELLAHLDGERVTWPVAVVAESLENESVIFRTYCSQEPVDGHRHVRPPILTSVCEPPDDVIARYTTAMAAADLNTIVATFLPDGYYREPIGEPAIHRGTDDLRRFFSARLSGGHRVGIEYRCCVVTDDAVRCAVEYNMVRWGGSDLPPQAGLAVFERGAGGLLAAVRVYDDIAPPG